jgi:hypothetical protein
VPTNSVVGECSCENNQTILEKEEFENQLAELFKLESNINEKGRF